uniref:Cytochrome c-552 (Fragments) n=1 Tax=Schinkia azotoformans TaxID=1454 RepID=CY552_SCHAZ|nr:RecName: Full=Cytochrome c-552; AltName: Full=Cytochrome c552 [Schinkia azotoformans]
TEQAAPAADDPEGMVKASCASCHGQNLEGGVGPALADVGSRNAMPAGMVDPAK